MSYFLQGWIYVLILGSPFALLMLITMLLIKKSNPRGYRMGWLNLLLLLIISFLIRLYAHIIELKPGNGGEAFGALFHIIQAGATQLVLFWLWLCKIKLEKQAEIAEKAKILDDDDPLLDEQPPTK